MTAAPVLEVAGLSVGPERRGSFLPIVDDLSFTIGPGEVLGVVGESGSGKTMTAKAVMGLNRYGRPLRASGSVRLAGRELLDLPERELAAVRGRDISMVFQDALSALNPLRRIGAQIGEVLRLHRDLSEPEIAAETVRVLAEVGIPDPAARVRDYPHQFSGGMRQRAMIAAALASDPSVLIADEPTTALDVTIQAQILELLARLARERQAAILLITHDLGVVAEVADRVLVMYGGRAVETGPMAAVMRAPRHPYTWGLLRSIPSVARPRSAHLPSIPGTPPMPAARPRGCPFRGRCRFEMPRCEELPELRPVPGSPDHLERCWLPRENRAERFHAAEAGS